MFLLAMFSRNHESSSWEYFCFLFWFDYVEGRAPVDPSKQSLIMNHSSMPLSQIVALFNWMVDSILHWLYSTMCYCPFNSISITVAGWVHSTNRGVAITAWLLKPCSLFEWYWIHFSNRRHQPVLCKFYWLYVPNQRNQPLLWKVYWLHFFTLYVISKILHINMNGK